MDSLTHIALGACMGELFAGKKLGNRAMVWGAIAQSFPDIDFVSAMWLDTPSNLLAHRGFTHSFLFTMMISPALALISEKLHRPHNISFMHWLLFFVGVIGCHVFIDAFNNYGTGWWEPFSSARITFNAIYVADPFFSIAPFLAMVFIIAKRKSMKWNVLVARTALLFCFLYLIICLFNKSMIDQKVRRVFQKQNIQYTQYFTTPAPLQNLLWYVVAGNEKGFNVGFVSVFDKTDSIHFEYFPRNEALLNMYADHVEVDRLKRFSQNFYTVEKWRDTLVFNDLRFGQMIGWEDPKQKFVFHYYLNKKADNSLVVQRGRFKFWDIEVAKNLVRRIFTSE